jgi:phage shock protein PspC (stress-responsive transcriptional regulator)
MTIPESTNTPGTAMNAMSPSTQILQDPPDFPIWFKVSIAVVAILGAFGNGIVIYLIFSRHQLRTKTNSMVASLAVSDLLVAVVLIPSFLICMNFKCDHLLSKLFYDGILVVSVCNLCCITFDRYLAVTRPLKYHTGIIQLPVKTLIAMSWILPCTVSLVPVIWLYGSTDSENQRVNNKIFYTVQVVLFMFCPCLMMLITYAVIWKIVRKQTQRIRREFRSAVITVSNTSNSNSIKREGKATLRVFGESMQKN